MKRILAFSAVIGTVALLYVISNQGHRTAVVRNSQNASNGSDTLSAIPPVQEVNQIEQLNPLSQTDPGKAQSKVPTPEYPEAARLNAQDHKLFLSEIAALTANFQTFESESMEVVFEGQRDGTIHRNVRIDAPNQEQLDQMAQAYSAVLAKYPKESELHTALWERITQLMRDYSRERLLVFSRSESGPWSLNMEVRSTDSLRGLSEVTRGVPDEDGRMKFEGPHKTSIKSAEARNGSKTSDHYSHLLTP